MATTPVAFLLSQSGKQVLLFSTFSIDQDAYRYSGQWNAGVFHGKGSYAYEDGGRYEGQWNKGQRHGHGIYTWVNGDQWIGNFKDDQIWESKGPNTYIKASGKKFIGTWKGKKFWVGQQLDQTDQLVARYSEGQMTPVSRHASKRGQVSRPRFKRSAQVRHWRFGRGSIVSMRGNHAQVRFESVGTKWLVLTYADLAID